MVSEQMIIKLAHTCTLCLMMKFIGTIVLISTGVVELSFSAIVIFI